MKKFESIVIVTDLDGTFINDVETTVKRNLDAVEYFKRNGGCFTVATGRVAQHVFGAVPSVAELVNLPAVTCNGACLYDFSTGTSPVLYEIDYQTVKALYDFVSEKYPQAGVRAACPDYCFITTKEDTENTYIKHDLERYKGLSHLVAPVEEWSRETIMKMVVRIDSDVLPSAMEDIKQRFGRKLAVTQSWPTIIDIQLGGVNKGDTFKKYVEDRFDGKMTVYACGDYINDLELLAAANVAVCPSNAHPLVKEKSQLCLCSNNEGLIADLVEYLDKIY